MSKLWILLTCAAVLLASETAQAQVHESDVRLYLDTSLVSWVSDRARYQNGGDWLAKDNQLGAGPGAVSGAGVGLGYAVTRHLIPSLYFSLQNLKDSKEVERDGNRVSGGDTRTRQWELRPFLEVPFNPGSRFVLHGIAGLTFLRRVDDTPNIQAFGVGPLFGLGGHGFISKAASLDLGLVFRTAFIRSQQLEDATGGNDVKLRQLAVFFTLGASFWL